MFDEVSILHIARQIEHQIANISNTDIVNSWYETPPKYY